MLVESSGLVLQLVIRSLYVRDVVTWNTTKIKIIWYVNYFVHDAGMQEFKFGMYENKVILITVIFHFKQLLDLSLFL